MCMVLLCIPSSFFLSMSLFPPWFAEEATRLLRFLVLEIGRVDPQFSSLEHLLPLLNESQAPVAAVVSSSGLFSFLSTLAPSAPSVDDVDAVQQYLGLRLTKDQNHRLEVMCMGWWVCPQCDGVSHADTFLLSCCFAVLYLLAVDLSQNCVGYI
jgi:hypothetical protein